MKSLFLTGLLVLGVAHAGAFLSIWKLPYVENHLTIKDFGRKLDNVVKWEEKSETLREARATARDENYALYNKATPEQEAKRKALDAKKR